MENVKKEFIRWMIEKSKPNYFDNNILKWDKYLEESLIHFNQNIFLSNALNYKDIIKLIDQTINSDKKTFLKNHGAKDSGKLAAILGRENYSKFLFEKHQSTAAVKLKKQTYTPSLNQIFYGPPGTGKTYNTILEAAKIISGNEKIDYDSALVKFNENLGDRLEFITFHQNYSYEDFIQGLRPETETSENLTFEKKDGVFKRIADRALKNYKDANKLVQKKRSFHSVFEEFINPLDEGDVEELKVKMKKVSFFITNIKEKSIEFRKDSGGTGHTLSIRTLESMYDNEGIGEIKGLKSYYRPLLNKLLRIGILSEVEEIELKNYVIIIDEINRANISRVFGELITLIEKDKRSHGKIPITATLPSGDKFIVPSNLFIIGTMNTADKSIALLDIALRRRFVFKAMYPKYEIPNKKIHSNKFLEKLNGLIVNSGKGHDFTIGHSYFMDDDDDSFDFESTINNMVIPLMLEYYMNDESEVIKILNEALKQKKEGYKIGNWPLEIIN